MQVAIKHAFSAVTQKVIAAWYEGSNPTAEIGRRVLNPPHIDGTVMQVDNLRPVVYNFKFYQSADGITLQTLLHSWSIDASQYSGVAVEQYVYVVGRGEEGRDADNNLVWQDPVAGSFTLTDKRLHDLTKDQIELEFRGFGARRPDEYELADGGGILLVEGETFNASDTEGDTIIVKAFRPFTQRVTEPIPAGINGLNIVAENGDFGSDYIGKNNLAAFNTTIGTTVFPAFSTIANCSARFSTYGGSQRYWKLQFSAGNTVQYMGKARNAIYLATNEVIELTWKDGACYVTDGSGTRYDKVGEIIPGGRQLIGTILADGNSGIELNVSEYQRLIDELTPAQTCSYADYNATQQVNGKTYYINRGKFAISADGTKFKIPDLRGYTERYLKVISGSDASRFSGGAMSLQKDGVNMNGVSMELRNGKGGSSTNPLSRGNNGPSGFAGCDYPDDWAPNTISNDNKYIRFTGGATDTVSDNVGKLPLIVL